MDGLGRDSVLCASAIQVLWFWGMAREKAHPCQVSPGTPLDIDGDTGLLIDTMASQ